MAGFDFPDVNLDHELLALHDPGRYAVEDGQVASASGLAFPAAEFSRHVAEYQVPHSTALHARLDGRGYLTGPLARYTINSAQLSPVARQAAAEAGPGATCRNPFRSIVVRAVETVYAATTPRSPRYANGLSATTTRASPAPPTSSISA